MTGDVDLDRLADYLGGALEGTPDETAVAHLVATDPAWTRAHAALVAADAAVRADLARLAAESEPVPTDVLARLDAALATEPIPTWPAPAGDGAGSRHLSVLAGGRSGARQPSRHRRWRTAVGVAAGIVAVGLAGTALVPQLGRHDPRTSGIAGSDAAGSASTPLEQPPDPASGETAVSVTASGTDYTPQTLATLGGPVTASHDGDPPKSQAGPNVLQAPSESTPHQPPQEVPAALRPLTDPEIRAACLKALAAQYGGTATSLDYARYQGTPALVVLLDGTRGLVDHRRVVVVGPNCGTGGLLVDERYSVPVG
ncbi:hypothetical protein ACNTMW_10745 [Planosporangium sp. 12N6]|uniref:hypothetical protein n=1 Tax=Planosporangium spinosum TaxID=3402278 RepID=UPI003CEE7F27